MAAVSLSDLVFLPSRYSSNNSSSSISTWETLFSWIRNPKFFSRRPPSRFDNEYTCRPSQDCYRLLWVLNFPLSFQRNPSKRIAVSSRSWVAFVKERHAPPPALATCSLQPAGCLLSSTCTALMSSPSTSFSRPLGRWRREGALRNKHGTGGPK